LVKRELGFGARRSRSGLLKCNLNFELPKPKAGRFCLGIGREAGLFANLCNRSGMLDPGHLERGLDAPAPAGEF